MAVERWLRRSSAAPALLRKQRPKQVLLTRFVSCACLSAVLGRLPISERGGDCMTRPIAPADRLLLVMPHRFTVGRPSIPRQPCRRAVTGDVVVVYKRAC